MRKEEMREQEMSVKFGVQASQGNTTWPDLVELWEELDRDSGFDYLWLVDHFVPGQGTAMGADGPHWRVGRHWRRLPRRRSARGSGSS